MKLRVKGKVRYKRTHGFGPFKKTVWEDGSFDVQVAPGENLNPIDGVKLTCSERDGTITLDGSVKDHPCFFGSVVPEEGKRRATFIMTSVRNIEVRGEISIEE